MNRQQKIDILLKKYSLLQLRSQLITAEYYYGLVKEYPQWIGGIEGFCLYKDAYKEKELLESI